VRAEAGARRTAAVPRRRRTTRYLAGLVLGALALAALIPSSRIRVLRGAGSFLVSDDPLGPADAVVVTVDAREAGVLEAADLVRRQMAPRVAVMAAAPTPGEREFLRRGLPYEDDATAAARNLTLLGVPEVERVSTSVDGTNTAGQVLREWCVRRQVKSVIVVSTRDHSRRLRRVLQRAMRGVPVRVVVRASPFSAFDPDSWWLTRTGIRTQIIETEKLLLDFVSHPVP
jgi:uncharacterized SAM-binding protein YcdF (DUF218 family)